MRIAWPERRATGARGTYKGLAKERRCVSTEGVARLGSGALVSSGQGKAKKVVVDEEDGAPLASGAKLALARRCADGGYTSWASSSMMVSMS